MPNDFEYLPPKADPFPKLTGSPAAPLELAAPVPTGTVGEAPGLLPNAENPISPVVTGAAWDKLEKAGVDTRPPPTAEQIAAMPLDDAPERPAPTAEEIAAMPKDFTPDDVARTPVMDLANDKEFSPVTFALQNPDAATDPKVLQQLREVYRQHKLAGVTGSDVWEGVKGIPGAVGSLAKAALDRAVNLKDIFFTGPGSDAEQKAMAESAAAMESAGFGMVNMARGAGQKLAHSFPITRVLNPGDPTLWDNMPPGELDKHFFNDVAAAKQGAAAAEGRGALMGDSVEKLAAQGIHLDPSKVESLTLSDPLTFAAFESGFKILNSATGAVLGRAATAAKAQQGISALRRTLGTTVTLTGKGIQKTAPAVKLGGQILSVASPILGTVSAVAGGEVLPGVLGVAGGTAGAAIKKLGKKVMPKFGAKIAAAGERITAGTEGAATRRILDLGEAGVSTLADIGKGATVGGLTALATSEDPEATKSLISYGGAFAVPHVIGKAGKAAVKGVSGAVEKEFLAPGAPIGATESPGYGTNPALDAVTANALAILPEAARNRINLARELSKQFGSGSEIHAYSTPEEGALMIMEIKPGITEEQALHAASQNGVTFKVGDKSVVFINAKEHAVGHEFGHLLEAALPEEINVKQDAATRSQFTDEQWNELGTDYTELLLKRKLAPGEAWRDALAPTAGAMGPDTYMMREHRAENFDELYKNRGDSLGTPESIYRRVMGAIGRSAEALGIPLVEKTTYLGHPASLRSMKASDVALRSALPKGAARPVVKPTAKPAPPGTPASTEAINKAREFVADNPSGLPDRDAGANELLRAGEQGTNIRLTYWGAKGDPAGNVTSVRPERRAEIEAQRGAENSKRQLVEKELSQIKVVNTSKGPQFEGYSPDNYEANREKLGEWLGQLSRAGVDVSAQVPFGLDAQKGRFTAAGNAALAEAAGKFMRNQAAGFTGSGKPIIMPKEGIAAPGGKYYAPEKTGAAPEPLDQNTADIINYLFHSQIPETVSRIAPLHLAGQDIATATGRPPVSPVRPRGEYTEAQLKKAGIEGPRAPMEVNPFRQWVEQTAQAAGIARPSLIDVTQRLNFSHIEKAVPSLRPEPFGAKSITLAAGFQPRAWKVSGTKGGLRTEIEVQAEDLAAARKAGESQGMRVERATPTESTMLTSGAFQPKGVDYEEAVQRMPHLSSVRDEYLLAAQIMKAGFSQAVYDTFPSSLQKIIGRIMDFAHPDEYYGARHGLETLPGYELQYEGTPAEWAKRVKILTDASDFGWFQSVGGREGIDKVVNKISNGEITPINIYTQPAPYRDVTKALMSIKQRIDKKGPGASLDDMDFTKRKPRHVLEGGEWGREQFQPSNDPNAVKVGAAVRDEETGKIYKGSTHYDALDKRRAERFPEHPDTTPASWIPGETTQGFLTNGGEFLTRQEAAKRAEEYGQVPPGYFGSQKGDVGLESTMFEHYNTNFVPDVAPPPAVSDRPGYAGERFRGTSGAQYSPAALPERFTGKSVSEIANEIELAPMEEWSAYAGSHRGKYGGGLTGLAFDIGSNVKTPGDLQALRESALRLTEIRDEMMKAVRESKSMEGFADVQKIGMKKQLMDEAYGAATGESMYGPGKSGAGSTEFIRSHVPGGKDYQPPMPGEHFKTKESAGEPTAELKEAQLSPTKGEEVLANSDTQSLSAVQFSPKSEAGKQLEEKGFGIHTAKVFGARGVVATKNGLPVGFFISHATSHEGQPAVHVDLAAVLPPFRKQGISTALASEMMTRDNANVLTSDVLHPAPLRMIARRFGKDENARVEYFSVEESAGQAHLRAINLEQAFDITHDLQIRGVSRRAYQSFGVRAVIRLKPNQPHEAEGQAQPGQIQSNRQLEAAQKDYDAEESFAKTVISQGAKIEDYPHYSDYRKTIDAESELLPANSKNILFIGSGPLPLSPMLMKQKVPGAGIDVMDVSKPALDTGARVAEEAGISFDKNIHADASTFHGFDEYDAVILSLEAGATDKTKQQILDNITSQLSAESVLLVRSSAGKPGGEDFVDVSTKLPSGWSADQTVDTFGGYGKTMRVSSRKYNDEPEGQAMPKREKKLPMEFWVAPNGKIIPAPHGHYDAAIDHILPKDWKPENELDPMGDLYPDVYAKGYVRGLSYENSIYTNGPRYTKAQRTAIEDASFAHNIPVYHNDRPADVGVNVPLSGQSQPKKNEERITAAAIKFPQLPGQDAQYAPKKNKKDEYVMPSSGTAGEFKRIWILPDNSVKQIGGTWHHDWLDKNRDTVDKYGMDIPPFEGNDSDVAREEALRHGFVRINYNSNNGLMTVEGRAADWHKRKGQVQNVVESNLDDIDTLRINLMNDAVNDVTDSRSVKLFEMDSDKEKLAALPFITAPEEIRAARMRSTDNPAFRAPEEESAPLPSVYSAPEFAAFGKSGNYIGKYKKYADAEKASAGGGSVKILKSIEGQAQPGQADTVIDRGEDWSSFRAAPDYYKTESDTPLPAEHFANQGYTSLDIYSNGSLHDPIYRPELRRDKKGRWPVTDDGVREAVKKAESLMVHDFSMSQAQPKFDDAGFEDALNSIRSGASGGHTFNPDGSLWNAPDKKPVDIVTLASVNVPAKELTHEKIVESLAPYSDLLEEPGIVAGVFSFSKDGKPTISIDLNAVVDQKHRANSIKFAKDNDQVAIFDAAKNEVVDSGGKGDTRLNTLGEISDALSDLQRGKPVNVQEILRQNRDTGPMEETGDLFGGKQTLSNAAQSSMTKAELAAHFPESVIPRRRDESIPSDIKGSPLFKEAGSEEAAVSAFARRLVEFANEHKNSEGFKSGAKWYSEFVPMLKKTFGSDAPIMAELLAATSPQNAPDTNYAYAVDALEGLKSGRFDKIKAKYEEGLAKLADDSWQTWAKRNGLGSEATPAAFLGEWIDKFNLKPRQSNGQLYGISSVPVLQVLARRWLENTSGPKTQNFVQNLLGTGSGATIDLWADRTMRRIGYAGFADRWRILPKNATAVSDADFAFSQRAFAAAAKQLGMQPDALQGALWFAEKSHWGEQGWSRLDLGDYRKEVPKTEALRAGVRQRLARTKAVSKTRPMQTEELLIPVEPRNLK